MASDVPFFLSWLGLSFAQPSGAVDEGHPVLQSYEQSSGEKKDSSLTSCIPLRMHDQKLVNDLVPTFLIIIFCAITFGQESKI